MRALTVVAVLLVLGGASCTKKSTSVVALNTEVIGLSGMTRDGEGALWAVGEAGDFVLRIDPETFAVDRYPVLGCPARTDLEAIASMGDGRFVVGTETLEAGRSQDSLLYGRVEKGRFIVGTIDTCDYGLWDLTAPDNLGIEGLCHVDGVLILATELTDEQRGRRWAPVAVLDLETRTWTAHRVALTSPTGKLAALACRVVDGAIAAMAVERHFGVSHLLRFDVPRGTQSTMIEPTVVADLAKLIKPLPNFEGLVWDADGSILLLTDNESGGVAREPTRLYFVSKNALR